MLLLPAEDKLSHFGSYAGEGTATSEYHEAMRITSRSWYTA